MEDDEQALLQRCLDGDQAACADLVQRHARMVGTVIWRVTGDAAVVEDLAQDTFLRVFRALPEFAGHAKFSTWACTIAHRVAIDHVRKRAARREESLAGDDEGVRDRLPPSPLLNPEAGALRAEIEHLVHPTSPRLQ